MRRVTRRMTRRAIGACVAALVVAAGTACAASRAGVVRGAWGAPGVVLDARELDGYLSYGCRLVEIHAPLVADANGDIRVRGTAQATHPAASGRPASPPVAVEVRGRRLPDERLQLVVAAVGATSGDTLVLSPGGGGIAAPCR